MTITLEQAQHAAAATVARARAFGKPIAVAVVDAGGHAVLVHRGDGVHAAATDVALAKARASALFNRRSGALEELMGATERPTLLALTSVVPGVLGVQGAVPVHEPAGVLGAIGVSGGTPAEDEAVAEAGAATFTTTEWSTS